MAFSIFISYSTKDIAHVEQVKSSLQGLDGVNTFIAEYSLLPGGSLSTDIQNAINGCDLFLLLWSENAKGSEWVPQEIGIAKAKNKSILPVVLASGLNLPGFIKDLKYLNIKDDNNDQMQWLRDHILTRAQDKSKNDNLILLGIGAFILWGLSD